LLLALAPTLRRLALKDNVNHPAGNVAQINPNLQPPPHNGNLDYALRHCDKLEELVMDWVYTGGQLIESIKIAPLHTIALLGAPSLTNGKQLPEAIAEGNFAKLETLILSFFPLHTRMWSGREIRFLRRVCEARGIQFTFS